MSQTVQETLNLFIQHTFQAETRWTSWWTLQREIEEIRSYFHSTKQTNLQTRSMSVHVSPMTTYPQQTWPTQPSGALQKWGSVCLNYVQSIYQANSAYWYLFILEIHPRINVVMAEKSSTLNSQWRSGISLSKAVRPRSLLTRTNVSI